MSELASDRSLNRLRCSTRKVTISWINSGSRKRLDLCWKRDWIEVPFTWRVRDNEAGSTVCRFHEILRNWSPWNVSEHHDEALVRDTYRQQSFLMTVSETCQYRILYTNVTPQWNPPVSREKRETKTYYFLSADIPEPECAKRIMPGFDIEASRTRRKVEIIAMIWEKILTRIDIEWK